MSKATSAPFLVAPSDRWPRVEWMERFAELATDQPFDDVVTELPLTDDTT